MGCYSYGDITLTPANVYLCPLRGTRQVECEFSRDEIECSRKSSCLVTICPDGEMIIKSIYSFGRSEEEISIDRDRRDPIWEEPGPCDVKDVRIGFIVEIFISLDL